MNVHSGKEVKNQIGRQGAKKEGEKKAGRKGEEGRREGKEIRVREQLRGRQEALPWKTGQNCGS